MEFTKETFNLIYFDNFVTNSANFVSVQLTIANKKCPAHNERFGASGGVSRLKSSTNLQVLCPA